MKNVNTNCKFTNNTIEIWTFGGKMNLPHLEDWPEKITPEIFEYFNEEEYNTLKELFGEEILHKHIPEIPVRGFLQAREAEAEVCDFLKNIKTCILGNKIRSTFTEHRGSWHREYTAWAYRYFISSAYRTWATDFLHACLLDRYPWLNEFTFTFYGNSYKSDLQKEEIYIYVEEAKERRRNDCLYVPIFALIKNDFQLVVNRMNSYFKSYYRSESYKQYLDEALGLLESNEAKRLKEVLNEQRK